MQVPMLSALDLRGQMAVARAIMANDHVTARQIACETVRHLVQIIRNGIDPALPVAWPIETDPELAHVYREGMRLLNLRNAFCELLEIAKLNAQFRKDAQSLALAQEIQDVPSAQTLLEQLQTGKEVEINQHTLSFDGDYQGLAGTNPYGIDYYAGTMTLENVTLWRTAMLSGQTWGASPDPEWVESGDFRENTDVRELELAISRVDSEFADLADIDWLSGKSSLQIGSPEKATEPVQA